MELTKINGKYELLLPKFRADRPEWNIQEGGWEYWRIEAMLQRIKDTDIVFDLGTECGDISALIAKYAACQMVLFEPNEKAWPCMKAIWEANGLKEPLDFFSGFISNETMKFNTRKAWKDIGGDVVGDHGFKQLYEQDSDIPQTTLDDYCKTTGIYPTIITMDCEGAEFSIIQGAIEVIKEQRPTIFMSVHSEFMHIHYGKWTSDLFRMMRGMDYDFELIDYDHELHTMFVPK
jgi:FkbM family methyltransferase